jgi:CubicO group peptidase (beta-lactamase class C family)
MPTPMILGLAMEKITGKPMQQLLAERLLGPLGLDSTTDPGTPAITEPALHAYSSERRYALKIPSLPVMNAPSGPIRRR